MGSDSSASHEVSTSLLVQSDQRRQRTTICSHENQKMAGLAAIEKMPTQLTPHLSNQTMTTKFDIGRPVSCLAIADMPTGGRCGAGGIIFAVGGRSILKVMRIGRDGITEVCSQLNPNASTLKKGRGAVPTATFDICGLAWSGNTTFAAATINGIVSIWDVDAQGACNLQRRIEAHKRTINKILWHPTEPLLASASHDGTLKFWDRRARMNREMAGTEGAHSTIQPNSGAVRDFSFSPNDFRVALACDSGVVFVYDRRRVQFTVMKWVGHGADVQCIEWHPTAPNLIATAAAAPDATCKVWDISAGSGDRAVVLHSISPAGVVNRLRWRPTPNPVRMNSPLKNKPSKQGKLPSHKWQLAMQCRQSVVQIWDVREPFLPIAVLHPPPSCVFETTDSKNSSLKKGGDVELGAFEWLDTLAPVSDMVAKHDKMCRILCADPSSLVTPLFHRNQRSSRQDEHRCLGLWQHLLTTVKLGGSKGSVLALSCAEATQPPKEVAPMCFSFSPNGELAVVHQPQPMIHHRIPPFHLHATILNNPTYQNNLGIFHVQANRSQQTVNSTIREDLQDDQLQVEALEVPLGSLRLTHLSDDYTTHSEPSASSSRGLEVNNIAENAYEEWTVQDEVNWNRKRGHHGWLEVGQAERCINAAELAARALGLISTHAMSLFLKSSALTAQNLEKLGRVFIGRRVLFAHRKGGGYIGGIDPRPGASITFTLMSSRKTKKGVTVCITDYLTSQKKYADYFEQNPLLFSSTLPCFKIANKDGRLDSFPMETCFVVLNKSVSKSVERPPFEKAALMERYHFQGGGYPLSFTQRPVSLKTPHSTPSMTTSRPIPPDPVEVLARRYRLQPSSSESPHECVSTKDLCNFNARVASEAGMKHLGVVWSTVASLLSTGDSESEDELSGEESDDSNESDQEDDDNDDDDGEEEEEEAEDDEEELRDKNQMIKSHVSTSTALALLRPQSGSVQKKTRVEHILRTQPPLQATGSTSLVASALLAKSVRELLEERCNCGDVQTCVALCTVLHDVKHSTERLVDMVSSEQQRREWTWCYIEHLRRLHLPIQANEFCKSSQDESIAQLNTNSTSVYAACASCKKPIASSSTKFLCTKCKAITSMCVLCREPVRGLYAVCPGCGHGGHLPHLRSWFADQTTCPSGCGHICDFNTFGLER